jgi:ABC-type Zn uptake system ZnuABC Zn-binding protein ZnuA
MQLLSSLVLLVPCAVPQGEPKKLEVVTTLGVLRSIAEEVGGDHVHAQALADPRQDPHFVEPRPTLMQKARAADLFVEIGLQLELWADKVVAGSGNARIQSGLAGRVVASAGVQTLELPAVLSREWGDVHPYGNPHIWLDPLNAKAIAENIANALTKVDPARAADYQKNLASFQERIDVALFGKDLVDEVGGKQLSRLARQGRLTDYLKKDGLEAKLGGWLAQARPLRERPIVTYHKSWIYFAERFGPKLPIEIEEKPGISPTARHRDEVLALMREQGVRTILEEGFYDRSAADYLAEKTGAHAVIVPLDLGPEVGCRNYFAWMDLLLSRVLESETAGGAAAK